VPDFLFWRDSYTEISAYVHLFIGVRLVSFIFHLPRNIRASTVDLVSSFAVRLPNLRNLHLLQHYIPNVLDQLQPPAWNGLSSFTRSFRHLASLTTEFPLTAEAIQYLSLLPSLKSFQIYNECEDILHVFDKRPYGGFANLRELCLKRSLQHPLDFSKRCDFHFCRHLPCTSPLLVDLRTLNYGDFPSHFETAVRTLASALFLFKTSAPSIMTKVFRLIYLNHYSLSKICGTFTSAHSSRSISIMQISKVSLSLGHDCMNSFFLVPPG
jgi:hypothetical protein